MEDLTDIEREEVLRRWWKDNWLWILGGVALGLALLGGWRYWQNYRVERAEAAESRYLAEIQALGGNKREEAERLATELREQYGSSPYADQADLALARAALDRRDFDEAARRLRVVVDQSDDAELAKVARTRLARVLIEQGKHDEALGLLDAAQAGAFAALYHEIRGDALAAKGDRAGAAREYGLALADASAASGLDRAYVELKRGALQ